ncbi:MAG: ATP-dependent Clp protease ATP-binding subunit [Treponema sp.]|nr:ATP-dependent Clp protease ATP-binding subunit [Treponema sp.]
MKVLSSRAKRLIVALAQDEGRKSGSSYILPEHVILAMLKSADGVGYALLLCLNVNVLNYQLALEQSLVPTNPVTNHNGEIPPSRRLNSLIEAAQIEARSLRDDYVGTEHIILAAIREDRSITNRYFMRSGLDFDQIRALVPQARKRIPSSMVDKGNQKFQSLLLEEILGTDDAALHEDLPSGDKEKRKDKKQSFLAEFSRDLTKECRENSIDPIVGRSKELARVIQILSRRTKNNPLLIGEPGVGKTAIVEGLSQAIVKGQVPYNLLKKRILVLDLGALIAGTKYRGDFEDRLKKIMNEVKEDKNILLFIDELHTIIGAGGQAGQMDASNMLKPALSRGEIQIIGATTFKEYRKYLEKDSAFERRFQVVKVDEPDDGETFSILEGIRKKYEEFHNVVYNDDVIPAIVKLSHRYIPERFLPDKAIDILDEAGAEKKISEELKPAELTELEKSIDQLTEEKKLLVANQDYESAALVRDKVVSLKKRLEEFSEYWQTTNSRTRKEVTASDVCRVISTMTGIPAEDLDDTQTQKLIHMEEELHKTVVGQEEAVSLISSSIRRSRAGVSSTARPMGSFIFLGPTGVGKTKLAKTLAKFLFGTEDSLLRIDMSDFMERHTASRLVGAPPGYVGYEEGGVLTEKVRQHPYSVILFDEIEKAHSDIFNLLLQVLEEGELTDGLGHTVSFRNTVIIMTSNAGAREIINENRMGFIGKTDDEQVDYKEIKASAVAELKKIMRPELINRIDDIIVFGALTKKEVSAILDIQLGELENRISQQKITLEVTSKAKKYLCDNGYEVTMGARPMRRIIQREIEDPLSLLILSRTSKDSATVCVDFAKDKLTVEFKKTDSSLEQDKPAKKKRVRKTSAVTKDQK